MSSFAGVEFSVEPSSPGFFPNMNEDEGITRYSCDVVFATRSARNSMASKTTLLTEKLSLGTKSVTVRINAGYGSGTLIVPSYGGTTITKTALLKRMSDSQGYGVFAKDEYKAKLEFVIIGASGV